MSLTAEQIEDDSTRSYALAINEKRKELIRSRAVRIGDATLYQGDCMELRHQIGEFDAILADPPYGVSLSRGDTKVSGEICGDGSPPDVRWMAAHPAIIWGGNNFCDQMPRSTGWLVWHKYHHEKSHHSQAELAWTNVTKTIRHYSEAYHGFMRKRDGWHHPTQKPPGLMRWCLAQFDPSVETVLDPFMGSGTTGIACAHLGKRFIGIEIDAKYFDIACQRIEEAQAQSDMFVEPPSNPSQISLI